MEEIVKIEHDLGALVLPLWLECYHSFEVGVGIGNELGIEERIGIRMKMDIGVVDVAFSVEEALSESLGSETGDDEEVVLFHCGRVLSGEGE